MILAIDPGMSGGLAYLSDAGELTVTPMPETDRDIVDTLRSWAAAEKVFQGEQRPRRAVIEDVPWVVGARVSPASTAKLHRNVGVLHGVLHALGYSIELVRPHDWQKFFSLGGTRKAAGNKWKAKLKAEAQRRFPYIDVTYATADALLILEWARRK